MKFDNDNVTSFLCYNSNITQMGGIDIHMINDII